MPKVPPTNSIKEPVYHNNSECTERNNIEPENLRQGTGGKRLCKPCKKLNDEGR